MLKTNIRERQKMETSRDWRLARRAALLGGAALAAGVALGITDARAQEKFPSETIELINNSAPGGGTDIFLRSLAGPAQEVFGTDIVVMSKTGGLAAVALNYVMSQPCDGHTVFAMNNGYVTTIDRGGVDATLDDIVPLVRGTDDPQIIMTSADGPFDNAQEMIKVGKERPLKLGGSHAGSIDTMAAMRLAKEAGMKTPIYVPFKSGGEILTSLIGGNFEIALLNYSEAASQIEAGKVVPLLVMAEERMEPLPDAPTTVELGIDATLSTVRGLAVLDCVPKERVAKLEEGFLEAMHSPKYLGYLESVGLTEKSIAGQEVWTQQVQEMVPTVREMLERLQETQ